MSIPEAEAPDGPFAAVQQYIAAFNAGDADAMAACFTTPGSILDGMAPHMWVGPSAPRDWYRDVLREGEHVGASDYHVALAAPQHADITGDAAYVVAPATMRFELRGEPVTQTGAVFSVALRRTEDGWRIAGWAWAKGRAAR